VSSDIVKPPSSDTAAEAPYIELLGVAYQVPLDNTAFESFLDTAHDFFAVNLKTGEISPSVLQNEAAQSELDTHTDRLLEIFDMAVALEKSQSVSQDPYHAVLQIRPGSLQVSGNDAASVLLKCDLPVPLEELPLDPDTRGLIHKTLNRTEEQDRIFLGNIGEDAESTCLGLIHRPADPDAALRISLSFVHWSETLLDRLGTALGLTESETQVLAGYLSNKTPKQIADERGRSTETIKAQSKSILRKTGCARIADLVQLSAGIAFMLHQIPGASGDDLLTSWTTPREHMHTLQRAGRTVAFYRHGTGKRTLVFLHALIQGPFFQTEFLEHLAARDFTLLAPSRPSYGYTSPPETEAAFEETSLQDALAVIDQHTSGEVHVIAQQLGTSHGARLVNALGPRAASFILVNGGIPLSKEHYSGMDRRVRLAAMSARHAPSVLKLSNALGLRSFRRRGAKHFLIDRYSQSEADMRALARPGALEAHALGIFHACEQGGSPFYLDELSKHSDWGPHLNEVRCPQYWLQPEKCRIVRPDDVRAVTERLHDARFTIEPDAGSIMLHERPGRVAEFISGAVDDALSQRDSSR
jgi:pimeloyl-ACP methyl ester carboxylesterase/DNA-binding CsgD family transcriptional regulator